MDSRKFKKINNDAPKLKHKKKKKQIHYKNMFKILLILLVIIFLFSSVVSFINDSYLPDNAELIYPSEFNLTPYAYEWNSNLYGCCKTNDSGYYYFTLSHMAALAKHSDNTFNYSEGIYVNYTFDEKNNVKIVDKIYDSNKREIIKPVSYDEYNFLENARFNCRDSPYCVDTFGFTSEEYADSIF